MKKIIQIILLFVFVNTAIAQTGNVGIGTPSPDPSSILDVTSTTKGFLFPRMSTTDRDAITTPAFGLTIFNTTINCLEMNLGSGTANWVTAVCPCLSAPAQPASFSGTGTGSNLCLSTNYVYTVPTVAGVQYYLWTITNGTIVSG